MTRSRVLDDILSIKPVVLEFLNNQKLPLGQKLFILNVYLDNLEQFGKKILFHFELNVVKNYKNNI